MEIVKRDCSNTGSICQCEVVFTSLFGKSTKNIPCYENYTLVGGEGGIDPGPGSGPGSDTPGKKETQSE